MTGGPAMRLPALMPVPALMPSPVLAGRGREIDPALSARPDRSLPGGPLFLLHGSCRKIAFFY